MWPKIESYKLYVINAKAAKIVRKQGSAIFFRRQRQDKKRKKEQNAIMDFCGQQVANVE